MFPLGERAPDCGARARWLNAPPGAITWIAEVVLFLHLITIHTQVMQALQIVLPISLPLCDCPSKHVRNLQTVPVACRFPSQYWCSFPLARNTGDIVARPPRTNSLCLCSSSIASVAPPRLSLAPGLADAP